MKNLAKRLTTSNTVIIGLGALIIGIILIFISETDSSLWGVTSLQELAGHLGGLIIISGGLGIIWDLHLRRSFVAEVIGKYELAQQIESLGLDRITFDFQRGINWTDLIDHAKTIHIYFAYGRTWRGTNETSLKQFLNKKGATMHVVLPNYNEPELVRELAKRFDKGEDDVKKEIASAAHYFKDRFERYDEPSRNGTFTLSLSPVSPVFSYYKFDDTQILSLYKHRHERGGVPSLVVDKEGDLSNFLKSEFEFLSTNSQAIY